jgi:hypothetical protein
MFHGGPTHSGAFASPELRAGTPQVALVVQEGGGSRTVVVDMKDAAGGSISWSASEGVSWINLVDGSGKTPDTLRFTINLSGLTIGTHSGSIAINSSFGKPSIAVTVRVVNDVSTVYLPSVER